MRIRNALVIVASLGIGAGCDSTEPNSIAGTYVATTFLVSAIGVPPTDVIAAGGNLTIIIAANNSATGTLTLPGSLVGGADITESMTGTAVRTGNTVQFDQTSDTFIRDLVWTVGTNTLRANQTVVGVTLDITLTRLW